MIDLRKETKTPLVLTVNSRAELVVHDVESYQARSIASNVL